MSAGGQGEGVDVSHADEFKRRALSGAMWSALEKWGARLLSTLVFIVLARLLDPAAFGLIALATVFIDIADRVREQGVTLALVQRKDLTDDHVSTAFWFTVVLGAVLGLLVLVLAGPLAAVLGEPELAPILQWLSLGFLVTALGRVPNALMLRDLRFRSLAARGLLANSVGGIVGITLAMLGAGVWALVAQNIVQAAVITLVLFAASRYVPRARFDRARLRELWSFGSRVLGFDLVNVAYRRGDDLIIGVLLGPVALGFYSVAYRLLMVITDTLARTIQQVAVPTFSRLQDEPERLRTAFSAAVRLNLMVAMPMAGGLAVVAPELVPVVFGAQWLPSVPAMQWLCVVGGLQGLGYFISDVMLSCGRPGLRLKLMIAQTTVTVAAFAVAATFGGFVAVAAASALSMIAFIPVALLLVKPLIGLRLGEFFLQLVPAAVSAVAMIAGVEVLRMTLDDTSDLVTLLLCVPTGVVIYLASMALVGRHQIRQLGGYWRLLRSRGQQTTL